MAHAPLGSVEYTAMAAAQGSCPGVQKVVASPALQVRRVQIHGADVLCDVSTGVARPLVPAAFRHPGYETPGVEQVLVARVRLRRGRMVP